MNNKVQFVTKGVEQRIKKLNIMKFEQIEVMKNKERALSNMT